MRCVRMTEAGLSSRYESLANKISETLNDSVSLEASSSGELTYVVPSDQLIRVCEIFRDQSGLQFEVLVDVCGVDYQSYGIDEWATQDASGTGFSRGVNRGAGPDSPAYDTEPTSYRPPNRFAVVYHLLSISLNHRVRLKTFCPSDDSPIVDSVIDVWRAADWFEREAFDLYGILFRGHPDLRRLLTDYGFLGHPFRKDFPLSGHIEMRYDPEQGRVVYEPVSIEPRTLVPKVIRDDARYDESLKDRE